MTQESKTIYRLGTEADSYAVFTVFERTLADLVKRMGSNALTSIANPEALTRMWKERQPLFEHLARTANQFWVAERDGEVIGFARSIVRGNVRELTEFFVLPEVQSGGIGSELIQRAFPFDGIEHRSIIATADFRAQALYLKSGVYPRFPIYYFGRQPEVVDISSDLTFEPIKNSLENLKILGILDETLLGFQRDVDHSWLLNDRQGFIYLRQGQPVGYGYLGLRNGPFALLDGNDFPVVLGHAETQAASNGQDEFGIEVPMVNQIVVDYLLDRKFRLDSFIAVVMNNKPFGKFENYLITSPPLFI